MPNESYITGLRAVKNGKKSQCLNLSNARIKTYAQIQEMTEEQLAGVIICPDYPLEEGDFLPASRVLYDQETTVDEKIDELNVDIVNTLKYNPSTDYFGMVYNGVWHDVIRAYFQFDGTLYDNGIESVMWDWSSARQATGAGWSAPTVGSSSFSLSTPNAGATSSTVSTQDKIDVTDFSVLHITDNNGTHTYDISSANGEVYIGLSAYTNLAQSQHTIFAILATNKSDMENTAVIPMITVQSGGGTVISRTFFKIWLT